MEEELNEEELEERLYAMIHYADDSQTNVEQNESGQNVPSGDITATAPKSTLRRYWRSSEEHATQNTQFQKVNTHNQDVITTPTNNKASNIPSGNNNKISSTTNNNIKNTSTSISNNKSRSTSNTVKNNINSTSKEAKKEVKLSSIHNVTNDLSIIEAPISSNIKMSTNILESVSPPNNNSKNTAMCTSNNKISSTSNTVKNNIKSTSKKEVKSSPIHNITNELSIFESPISSNIKMTIQILEPDSPPNNNSKNTSTCISNNKICSTSNIVKNNINSTSKKEVKSSPIHNITNDLSIFESPISSNIKMTIKILEPDSPPKDNSKNTSTCISNNKICSISNTVKNKTLKEIKKEVRSSPIHNITNDLSIFESPILSNIKMSNRILESEGPPAFDIQTSDDDEVIEVAIPPKPTVTIESSDEDEVCVVIPQNTVTTVAKTTDNQQKNGKRPAEGERDSASPVPSVVSSVSDEFIRGDCIAWNISSRTKDNPTFDFSLHGSDLLDKPSSKKKKKKKNRDCTSTPLAKRVVTESAVTPNTAKVSQSTDGIFATPKNKSKNKKQKTYAVSKHSIPNADVYDSDSNQSTDNNKKNYFNTLEKSLLNADVYESDSNHLGVVKKANLMQEKSNNEADSSNSSDSPNETPSHVNKQITQYGATVDPYTQLRQPSVSEVVDLTEDISMDASNYTIEDNIIMANVTGFEESDDYGDEKNNQSGLLNKLGSTKIPAILSADLDFDNLKGNENSKQWRRYSLTTLRNEMEKFYNESWGGEDFNHKEIQKSMPRDKSLWEIDPKDRISTPYRRKVTCNYCNRVGHRDDMCRQKPPVCHMCGTLGHCETRCPHKMCVNCGSPNYIYSSVCRNCSNWGRVMCSECRQPGHPASHCPDLWRRYHSTISYESPLVESHGFKKYNQQFCSGCTRRGHLVHNCRVSLPFSGLPINSPYVVCYRPLHPPFPTAYYNKQPYDQNSAPAKNTKRNKRQSKSPAPFENQTKKRMSSTSENNPGNNRSVEIVDAADATPHRPSTEVVEKSQTSTNSTEAAESQPAPEFIPISGNNHDKQGHMIQNNEVSDTSDAVSTARIYVNNQVIEKIKTEEGSNWLKQKSELHNIVITPSDINDFLNIKGKVADQEAFQAELRDWSIHKSNVRPPPAQVDEESYLSDGIPKKRHDVITKLDNAFESLNNDLGEPKDLFKELKYFENYHTKLIKQKVISPKKLNNNKGHINDILKRLNMVLLGQAGLADGPKHLSKLHSLKEKLTQFGKTNIPMYLRKQIGQHYHCIFNSVPRSDYHELLNIYYTEKQAPMMSKKKLFKVREKKSFNDNVLQNIPRQDIKDIPNNSPSADQKRRLIQKTVSKMNYFYRQLLRSRPNDTVLKKTRMELLRQLHTHISSLDNKDRVASKALKKMKKLQAQANLFLSNNYV